MSERTLGPGRTSDRSRGSTRRSARLVARSSASPPRRARACPRRRWRPSPTQPANGTTPSSLPRDRPEAEARPDRRQHLGEPLLRRSRAPCAAASRSTSRIWLSVSTGKSAPGMKIATPMTPFCAREALDQALRHTGPRSTGSRRASAGRRRRRAVRRSRRAISSTGKPEPGGHATTSVGEHVRDVEPVSVPVCTATTRHAGAVRGPEHALVLLRRTPGEHAHEHRGVLDARRRRARRPARRPRPSSFASCSASGPLTDERPPVLGGRRAAP